MRERARPDLWEPGEADLPGPPDRESRQTIRGRDPDGGICNRLLSLHDPDRKLPRAFSGRGGPLRASAPARSVVARAELGQAWKPEDSTHLQTWTPGH